MPALLSSIRRAFILTVNSSMLLTLDLSLEQLDRVHDYILPRTDPLLLRIIHILCDDLTDHYITLIECNPTTATFLRLL
jgi:hypothetical protein